MLFLFVLSIIVAITYFAALVLFLLPQRKMKEKKNLPFVSIIVATRNEEPVIGKTLRALRKIDYPRYEIIVVDGSTDKTAKIAGKYARVIKEKKPHGKAHALNLGIKKAGGEIIYIIDADSVVEKDTLKKLVHALGDKYQAAVGLNLPINKSNFLAHVGRIESAFMNSAERIYGRLLDTAFTPGRNFVVYKKTLRRLGGFRDALTEDINLSWRLYKSGKKVDFVSAVCHEQVPDRLTWYFKQQRRWFSGSFYEIKNIAKHLTPTEIFVVLPSVLFIAAVPAATVLSTLLYFLTNMISLLVVFFLGLILMLLSEIRYLDKGDVVYFFPALAVFGVFQWASILDAFFRIILRRQIKWYKTPKENL